TQLLHRPTFSINVYRNPKSASPISVPRAHPRYRNGLDESLMSCTPFTIGGIPAALLDAELCDYGELTTTPPNRRLGKVSSNSHRLVEAQFVPSSVDSEIELTSFTLPTPSLATEVSQTTFESQLASPRLRAFLDLIPTQQSLESPIHTDISQPSGYTYLYDRLPGFKQWCEEHDSQSSSPRSDTSDVAEPIKPTATQRLNVPTRTPQRHTHRPRSPCKNHLRMQDNARQQVSALSAELLVLDQIRARLEERRQRMLDIVQGRQNNDYNDDDIFSI
ncbi:hypothetical protein H0H93_000647, partial [Arthromyces matolae]